MNDLKTRFEAEFSIGSGMIHVMEDDMLSFIQSEITRERERIKNNLPTTFREQGSIKIEIHQKDWYKFIDSLK